MWRKSCAEHGGCEERRDEGVGGKSVGAGVVCLVVVVGWRVCCSRWRVCCSKRSILCYFELILLFGTCFVLCSFFYYVQVTPCVVVRCGVLQCVAVFCCVSQCVVVCCSVL